MSLNNIVPSSTSSLHLRKALIAKGVSYIPPIINSLPASILLAIEISPSLDKSSTEPISFKYILTGSSDRAPSSSDKFPAFLSLSSVSSVEASPCSTILTPISLIAACISSICSEEYSPGGKAAFNSSKVTKPFNLPFLINDFISELFKSKIGLSFFNFLLLSIFFFVVFANIYYLV